MRSIFNARIKRGVKPLGKFEEGSLAYELEYSHSESDGSVQFGDHDFDRSTAHGYSFLDRILKPICLLVINPSTSVGPLCTQQINLSIRLSMKTSKRVCLF